MGLFFRNRSSLGYTWGMDACSPLLKIDLVRSKIVKEKAEKRIEEWKRAKEKHTEEITGDQEFPHWIAFAELDAAVYSWINHEYQEKVKNHNNAIIALIIIII